MLQEFDVPGFRSERIENLTGIVDSTLMFERKGLSQLQPGGIGCQFQPAAGGIESFRIAFLIQKQGHDQKDGHDGLMRGFAARIDFNHLARAGERMGAAVVRGYLCALLLNFAVAVGPGAVGL